MTSQFDPDRPLICPNCQAHNTAQAIVCSSCGVNINDFRAALPRLQQLKSNKAWMHQELLDDEKEEKIQDDIRKSRKSFRNLILLLLLSVIVVGVLVSVGTFFYANHVKRTQAELRQLYQDSLTCLQNEDYLCARNGFQKLTGSGEDFPELNKKYEEAQFGLARQYYDSGQWESAVEELKFLLNINPGNKAAVDLLKSAYDRWIDQLGVEGKWLQRWMVRRERDSRFPPGDK